MRFIEKLKLDLMLRAWKMKRKFLYPVRGPSLRVKREVVVVSRVLRVRRRKRISTRSSVFHTTGLGIMLLMP